MPLAADKILHVMVGRYYTSTDITFLNLQKLNKYAKISLKKGKN